MQGDIENNKRKNQKNLEQGAVFFFVWMGIATLTFLLFALIDFIPEKPAVDTSDDSQVVSQGVGQDTNSNDSNDQNNDNQSDDENQVTQEDEEVFESEYRDDDPVFVPHADALPNAIVFDSLDRVVPILNPMEETVSALDTALLSGAVRHPGSADFKNTGTIFILGHSSYLPTVHNKNFQAFNGIQNLKWGDTIRLRSNNTEYVYSVDRVYEAKASDAMVPLQYETAKLTLATCNSFGSKDDRFIVEATLVTKKAL